jgi:hypothetical protein
MSGITEESGLEKEHKRVGGATAGNGLKLAVLIGMAFVLILLFVLLLGVLLLPALIAAGFWCFRKGIIGLRDALAIANTPTAKVSSAAMGLVELEGRALTDKPIPAAVTGTPCVWWDVEVELWQRRSSGRHKGHHWVQVMARSAGHVDTLWLEDSTGRMPVWLRGADVLLSEDVWESGKRELPAPGLDLLKGAGLEWQGKKRIRVREKRMEANGQVYVLGTLDEAHRLTSTGDEGTVERWSRWMRSGEWRKALVESGPAFLRGPMLIAIGYIELLCATGQRGTRAQVITETPPNLESTAVVVWKGRSGRPLIVSNQREQGAASQLRTRSLWYIGIGIALLCWILYEMIKPN